MRVGFIRLGRMGSATAESLLRAGHAVTVYNRTGPKAEALAVAGADVEEVVFSGGNVLDSIAAGAVHISSSTISPSLSRRQARGASNSRRLSMASFRTGHF